MRLRVWILSLALLAPPAFAGNRLTNSTFDSDLASWTNFGSASWRASDALGRPGSGSVHGENRNDGGFTFETVLLSACLSVTPGARYDGGIDYRIPAGQPVVAKAYLEISWFDAADCSAGGFVAAHTLVAGLAADGAWHRAESATAAEVPATASFALLRVEVVKMEAGGVATADFDNIVFKPQGTCGSTPDRLCLHGDRFEVEATFLDYAGHKGAGIARAMTDDTGYFWFFDAANVEVVVKVVDGCSYNAAYWVYAGGLTDVDVELVVTDARTGAVQRYANDLGTPFQPIGDIQALPTCP